MLYNPKWSTPSLGGFINWLSAQNPKATFEYHDCDNCALAQYLESIGTSHREYCRLDSGFHNLCTWNREITSNCKTFGQALKRAREYQASGGK